MPASLSAMYRPKYQPRAGRARRQLDRRTHYYHGHYRGAGYIYNSSSSSGSGSSSVGDGTFSVSDTSSGFVTASEGRTARRSNARIDGKVHGNSSDSRSRPRLRYKYKSRSKRKSRDKSGKWSNLLALFTAILAASMAAGMWVVNRPKIRPVLLPLVNQLGGILVDFVQVAGPDMLFLEDVQVPIATVPSTTVTAQAALYQTANHIGSVCDLGRRPWYLNSPDHAQAVRQLQEMCIFLCLFREKGTANVADDISRRLRTLNYTLGTPQQHFKITNLWNGLPSSVLGELTIQLWHKVEPGCGHLSKPPMRGGEKEERQRNYRECAILLLEVLNTVASQISVSTSSPLAVKMGYHLHQVQRETQHIVEGLERIRTAIPDMFAASEVLVKHPRVIQTWERFRFMPLENLSMKHDQDDFNVLRESNSAGVLLQLDKLVLHPLLVKLRKFQTQLITRVVKPLEEFGKLIRLLEANKRNMVDVVYDATPLSNRYDSLKVKAVNVTRPLSVDGVWVTRVRDSLSFFFFLPFFFFSSLS